MDLPTELMTKILDMVPISQWPSLELVNRKFQQVMHGLWGQLREIRLDEFVYNKEMKWTGQCQIVEASLEKFLFRAPTVALISGFDEFFNGSTPIRLETVQLLSKFQHLETISFAGQHIISARNFSVFLESSASRECWKSLDIAGGAYGSIRINQDRFGGQENQVALNLECFKFSPFMMGILDRLLPVQWSGLKKLVVIYIFFESANEVLSIIRQYVQISHLEIKIPGRRSGNGQPSYAAFMRGLADLENLRVLKISGDKSLHNPLLVLIRNLARRGITHLALVDCYCNDQTIDAIIDHLKNLTSLELNVENCTTASIKRLVNSRSMEQLKSLKLKFSSYRNVVNGAIVRAIGGNMVNLQCLHLYSLTNVKTEDFTSLGNLRNLKELRIKDWEWRMDCGTIETWSSLGFGWCMETLELSFGNGITPAAICAFFKNMARLRSMKLSGVMDGDLEIIAIFCSNLVEIDLWQSKAITSTGIQYVIDYCSQLKIVNVRHHSGWFPTGLTVGKYRKIMFKSG